MVFLLSVGLSFETGQIIWQQLRAKEPDFTEPKNTKRYMIVPVNGKMTLMLYEKEKAIAFLESGKTIISLW